MKLNKSVFATSEDYIDLLIQNETSDAKERYFFLNDK